jgi:uncharacterized protein
MRRVYVVIVVSIITLFLTVMFGKSVLAYISPGSPTGYVNDFAGILNAEVKTTLESQLTQFTKDTSSEISVVTITNLGDDTIENYANELFREWGIGTKEKNNGVLLLISKEDRELRIEVGYGLEGVLPDALANQIIRNDITPLFKQENYDDGVISGVQKIIDATKGEYVATPEKKKGISGNVLEVLFFVFIFGFNILVSILAPSKSWWLGGVIGGVLGGIIGFIFWSIIGGAILGGVLLGLGLLIDYFVSKGYDKHKNDPTNPGGFWGGFGGRSGSGSGGFGGFSGGSSGGGGASGGW